MGSIKHSAHTALALDPGKSDAGSAFFVNGRLVAAQLIAPKDGTPFEVAKHVAAFARKCMIDHADPDGRIDSLIVEGQQIYPGRAANPNDLLPLAQCVGGVLARVDHKEHKIILPRMWTGSVPKEVRIKKFLSTTTEEERKIIEAIKCPKAKLHNVIDAICMGFWALERVIVEPKGGWEQ